jgi:hypothetical protein
MSRGGARLFSRRLSAFCLLEGIWCGRDLLASFFMDERVVLYRRKRIVVVMQKFLPLRILRRLPESFGVRFQSLPTREQNVAALLFDAALQLVGDVADNTADVDRRFGKVALEGSFLAWLHVEDGEFEDHFLANVGSAGNRRAGVEAESTMELGQDCQSWLARHGVSERLPCMWAHPRGGERKLDTPWQRHQG